MKTFSTAFIITGILIIALSFVWAISSGPDVLVKQGETTVASTVCGTMYAADSRKASRADFQVLLEKTREQCQDELGTETTHRNEDGSLKHAVLVDDSCIINWELSQVAAFAAFEDVCLNKNN